jgi:hypothetical protein
MIKLSVSALQRSVDFYRLLGFAPLFEPAERRGAFLGSLYGVECDSLRRSYSWRTQRRPCGSN